MERLATRSLLLPVVRALTQLEDPTFRGVLFRTVAWSILSLVLLYAGMVWVIHWALELNGWLAWVIDLLGSIAAAILTLWLFLPVAAIIGTLYFDSIALAVERRFYPWLPPPNGAPLLEQAWDGVMVAFKVLLLNLVGLILAIVLPGVGLVLGWMIAAYGIGRGLFVAVAMRRMPRTMAESLYHSSRVTVLFQGAILALAVYIPVMNLLLPIIGVAAMVHVLDIALSETKTSHE